MHINCRYFAMRRRREETQNEAGCSKKRRVEHATFLKWKRNLDRKHQTLSWLKCDSAVESGKKVVFKLYFARFVHDQHTHAMSLLKKQRALSAGLVPSSYAPIAQAFAKPSDEEREKLRAMFDIAYFVGVKIFRSRNIRTFVSWRLVTECRLARLM